MGRHRVTVNQMVVAKKAHDWRVDQVADFFRTTYKVKTQQVVKSRDQHCGDIELVGYLANEAGPVSLGMDLRIDHDRIGSSDFFELRTHLGMTEGLRSISEFMVVSVSPSIRTTNLGRDVG